MEEKITDTFLNDHRGMPIFRVQAKQTEAFKDTSVGFAVYEIMSWSENPKTKEYDVPSEEELYLKAEIMWDSHCHVWFGEETSGGVQNAYLHLCGGDSWRKHVQLMEHIYNLAFQYMNRKPEEREEFHLKDL